MKRALVVAPQWIGDAVMTEPLLRRLAARGEHITVGALPWVAPVYRAMPNIAAEVVEFPFAHGGLQLKARRTLASQFKGQFDVAYVLPNSLKSALLPFLASIPERVGYLGEARVGLLTHRLKNPPKGQRPPMVAFYSALSGAPAEELINDRPRLQLKPEDASAAQTHLASLGLHPGRFHVFAPGAEFGPAKRWPAAHFAELGRLLPQENNVVLLGSGKEAELCEQIASAINAGQPAGTEPRALNLAGKTTLLQAFGAIATAHSVISNDSGLMHVAAGFGTPQVAIFGSSSPHHTPPLNGKASVIWLKDDPSYQPPLDCAPCFQRECPLGHTRCLNDVAAARVAALVTQAVI
jgi:heptosyltransferase-2